MLTEVEVLVVVAVACPTHDLIKSSSPLHVVVVVVVVEAVAVVVVGQVVLSVVFHCHT